MEGRREEKSKLADDSGSRRSTFMVRQFIVAMINRKGKRGVFEGILSYAADLGDIPRIRRRSRGTRSNCCDGGNVPLRFSRGAPSLLFKWTFICLPLYNNEFPVYIHQLPLH